MTKSKFSEGFPVYPSCNLVMQPKVSACISQFMVTFLESLPYCFQSFSPKQGCFNLELMEHLSGTGTHGADATKGTQGCWSDTHCHCGAGADEAAPTLLSLPGTWGGRSAQQEGENNHSLLCLQPRRERSGEAVSRGRHKHTDPVQTSAPGIPPSPRMQAEGFKQFWKTIYFTFFTLMFSSWRSDGRLSKWGSWNILIQGCIVWIIHYNLHSPVDFSAFEFYEDSGFSLFYIILLNELQEFSHLLLHAPKSQQRVSIQ